MAINKKLIHFNKFEDFEKELKAGNILKTSIVFIGDRGLIYTHEKGYQSVPSDGVKGQVLMTDGEVPYWGMIESENLTTYGVSWKPNAADPQLVRIGNPVFHKTLPLQSAMKGCIFDTTTKTVVYWLNENDWRLPSDLTSSLYYTSVSTEGDVITLEGVNELTDADARAERYIYESTTGTLGIITSVSGGTVTIKALTDNLSGITGNSLKFVKGPSLNGYDGEVMVYVPEFWIHSEDTADERSVKLSLSAVDETWDHSEAMYVGAYESTVLNRVPENMGYLSKLPANSAISVANTADYCRGGGNRTANDTYLETDIFRTDLGKPRSNISRANMRNYHKNGNKQIMSYLQYKNLYWLYVVEYANFNSQAPLNSALTADGHKQGGLGNGLTTLNGTSWSLYNGYYSICPCGYTNEFGNGAGEKVINAADSYRTSGATTMQNGANQNRATQTWTEDGGVNITKITANANVTIGSWTSKANGEKKFKVSGLREGDYITIAGVRFNSDGEQSIALRIDTTYTIITSFGGPCNVTIEQEDGELASVAWSNCTRTVNTNSANITAVTYSADLYTYARTILAGTVKFKVTGLEEGKNIYINGSRITTDGEYTYNLGNAATGTCAVGTYFTGDCNITIKITEQTATDVSNSLASQANRWRGIENPFGDIWKNVDGIIIDANANASGRNNMDYVYISRNPEDFNDSDVSKYTMAGEALHQDGYIKEWNLGTAAHIIPRLVGGSTTTFKCDYRYSGEKNTSLRTLFLGGGSHLGASAGLGSFNSLTGVGYADASIGFRSALVIS